MKLAGLKRVKRLDNGRYMALYETGGARFLSDDDAKKARAHLAGKKKKKTAAKKKTAKKKGTKKKTTKKKTTKRKTTKKKGTKKKTTTTKRRKSSSRSKQVLAGLCK